MPPGRDRFAAMVEPSGLTGRGGASFPSATKLALVRSGRGRPTLVVNAMEGEPASAKDKVLLSCVPHLVLDGAQLAACALGATRIVVCVPDDAHDARGRGRTRRGRAHGHGTGARGGRGAAPTGALRRGRRVGVGLLVERWARRAEPGGPTRRKPLPIGRSAALVHNAETLAHMALIARYGPGVVPRRRGPPTRPGRRS